MPMTHPFDAYRPEAAPTASAPFILEQQRLDQTPAGSFRPQARFVLSPDLRTSGFWHSLPPDEFKTLLLMLTFLTPNGWCRPTLPQIAEAMQTSQAKARARMQRLEHARWRGRPVVRHLPPESGPEAWSPAPGLLDVQEALPAPPAPEPLPRPAGREAVIAWSRARYARPRAEVERDIAQRMGWGPPAFDGDDPAVAEGKRQAYGQLTSFGVSKEQALDVLGRFDLSRIERQIEWLPHRQAKSPARFLLAAIEGDYEPPLSLRRQVHQEPPVEGQSVDEQSIEERALPEPAPAEHSPALQDASDVPLDNASSLDNASNQAALNSAPTLPGSAATILKTDFFLTGTDFILPETNLTLPETGSQASDEAPGDPSPGAGAA